MESWLEARSWEQIQEDQFDTDSAEEWVKGSKYLKFTKEIFDENDRLIPFGVRVAMERKPGVFGDHAVSVRDRSSGVDASHASPGRARR